MRGFPPTQIMLILLAFCLLAVPLLRLTGNPSPEPAIEHPNDGDHDHGKTVVKGGDDHPEEEHVHEEVAALLRLRFAHRPLTVSLKQEDRELLEGVDLQASPIETDAQLEIDHEGNELLLSVTWPEGTPETAVTIELEPDGFEARSDTRWTSMARLDEILTFQW